MIHSESLLNVDSTNLEGRPAGFPEPLVKESIRPSCPSPAKRLSILLAKYN